MTAASSPPPVTIVAHPLVQDALTRMRDAATAVPEFRRLMRRVGAQLAYEATRDLPTAPAPVETPLERIEAPRLVGPPPAVVSVLRAGDGLVAGALDTLPGADVGHVGLYRDPETLQAIEYLMRLPDALERRTVLVCDPMLATGHSAVAALDRVVAAGAVAPRFVCLLAAPEGLAHVAEHHPATRVWTAAIDRQLDERGYILPGLGDAGDRLFGTPH